MGRTVSELEWLEAIARELLPAAQFKPLHSSDAAFYAKRIMESGKADPLHGPRVLATLACCLDSKLPADLRRWMLWGVNRYLSGKFKSLQTALGIVGRGPRASEAIERRYAEAAAFAIERRVAGASWDTIMKDAPGKYGISDERELRRIVKKYEPFALAILSKRALSQRGDALAWRRYQDEVDADVKGAMNHQRRQRKKRGA